MKILVCHPYAINTPHFETDLEIIQRHLDEGDEITLLACNANLLACDVNKYHDVRVCLSCMGRRSAGLALLSKKITIKPLYSLTKQDRDEIRRMQAHFKDLAELKNLKIEDFDIGYGVLSSLISATRNPEPDMTRNGDYLERMLISSLAVYRSVQNYLSVGAFDRVYSYNGRYAPLRAVLRASQSRNTECIVHERGSRITRFALFKNSLPHDIAYMTKVIQETWLAAGNKAEREKIGAQFYLDKTNAVSHTWIAYTKDQQKDLLPQGWDAKKNNIALYISSEDEFAAIGDTWKHSLYDSQFDGIRKILEDTKGDPSLHFYLRVHPNLRNVKNMQTEQLASLTYPHLTVIPADSVISSYTLLQEASKVITFGSTIGIEATYWGKPSILAGQCYYRNLGVTRNPETHKELLSLLHQDLLPQNREGVLMYGYYFNTFGTEFRYYQAIGIYEGLFKGKKIEAGSHYISLAGLLAVSSLGRIVSKLSLSCHRHKMGRT